MTETTWEAVTASTSWLDASNGTGDHELTCRILKVTEEAGETAAAWIGTLGRNPRKGVTHTREQTAAELADVAISALVAIRSLGFDPQRTVDDCARKVLARLGPASLEGLERRPWRRVGSRLVPQRLGGSRWCATLAQCLRQPSLQLPRGSERTC